MLQPYLIAEIGINHEGCMKTAINNKEKVILYNDKHIRYFSDPNDTANEILTSVVNNNNKVNYPKNDYMIVVYILFLNLVLRKLNHIY